MQDIFQRKIDYLRISITDRCNLRCRYCMPETGVPMKSHDEILSLEEIFQLVEIATLLGFTRFRLTGGEPLVRKGLVSLIKRISSLEGVEDISLTTNGVLLAAQAEELKKAGLNRVNISLDTLKEERFEYITRYNKFGQVLEGIDTAIKVGLNPVKINVVASKGFNDDEIVDFAHLTLEKPLHIRFIELMPIGESDATAKEQSIPTAEIKRIIGEQYELIPATLPGSGPAKYLQIPGAIGTIGFIGALSDHFCASCNRLRLTADGKLRPCLHKDLEYDLRGILRQGGSKDEIKAEFVKAIRNKPEEHTMNDDAWGQERSMFQIGG